MQKKCDHRTVMPGTASKYPPRAPTSCAGCRNAFCARLSHAAKADLFAVKVWFTCMPKQEQLFFFDNKQMLIIESGNFMTIRHDCQGRHHGVDIIRTGDLLGVANLFNETPHDPISIFPFEPIGGCMLSVSAFELLCGKHADLAVATITQLSGRFNRLISHISNQAFGNSREKIKYSLELSRSHLGNFYLTHEQIALLSGLNRVTVTKLIGEVYAGSPPKMRRPDDASDGV